MMNSGKLKQVTNSLITSCVGIFGVPDSTMSPLIREFERSPFHVGAANEGNAVAMAIGFWLETGSPGIVYMQNSGLLNAGNPLTALVSELSYDIPINLIVGWRGHGEPPDEPQHKHMGLITQDILTTFGFQVEVCNSQADLPDCLQKLSENKDGRLALLVARGVFEQPSKAKKGVGTRELTSSKVRISRRDAIFAIMSDRLKGTRFISGTGFISRESHKLALELGIKGIFRMVGGMGHSPSVAHGMLVSEKLKSRVSVIEGDGGALMHLGQYVGLASSRGIDMFLLNNGTHESVGGHPTVGHSIDWTGLARALGFKDVSLETTKNGLSNRCQLLDSLGSGYSSTFTVVDLEINNQNFGLPRPEGLRQLSRDFKA